VIVDAHGWNERYSKRELEWGAEPNRFLVQELEGLQPGRALDLGAGEGRNAIWLAEQGWTVTAVDFSRVGIGKGRVMASQRHVEVEWVVADLLDYEATPDHFDLVIIFYVHIPKPEWKKVLREAQSSLKPEGTLLIVGHDRANLTEGVGGPQDPTILLDAAEVAAELTGMSIEKAEPILRPVEGEDRDAIDTLVRARRPSAR
jgi:2-polyprenyl-3-methyl-5-hydroxy-6-metoxy-1,4-benzoquinol methylase